MPEATRSFLAGAALRLANWAAIKGTISPVLGAEPHIVPVVLVDNITLGYQGPGTVGRIFALTDIRIANSLTLTPIAGIAGVIIDRIYCNARTGLCDMRIELKGQSVVPTAGGNVSFVLDDLRSVADEPGPLRANGAVVVGQNFWAGDVGVGETVIVECGFFLAPGSFLTLTSLTAVNAGRFTVHGREVGKR